MKRFLKAALVILLFSISALFAQGQSGRRVALVIGVQNYKTLPPLRNSLNDAKSMAKVLEAKGFQVDALYDPQTKSEIKTAISKYYNIMREEIGAVGIIYYAGHGMQFEGINYLIPASTAIESPLDLETECIGMNGVMSILRSASKSLNILLLDACRTIPSFTRDVEQGWAKMEAPQGSIIVFATQPGKVASDGTNSNGLFTSKFLKAVNEPNLNITDVFKKVKQDVFAESGQSQLPSVEDNSIGGDFFFSDSKKVEKVVTTQPTVEPTIRGAMNMIVNDTFDDNRNNWWIGKANGGSQKIDDGKLEVNMPDKGWSVAITPDVVLERDFMLEGTFRQSESADNNGLGLMWGYSKDGDLNYFIVSPNGYFLIGLNKVETAKGSLPQRAGDWVTSRLINPMGQANVLKVEQIGGVTNFYINGGKVNTTPVISWAGSQIGIVGYTKMKAVVDDFKFMQD